MASHRPAGRRHHRQDRLMTDILWAAAELVLSTLGLFITIPGLGVA